MKLDKKLFIALCAISLSQLFTFGSANADSDRANRPLDTIAAGEIKIDVSLEVPLADGAFFDPISLSPDIYYGINDDLSIGLVHSSASQGLISAGSSLRLGGGNSYNNVGFEGQYTFLRQDTFSLAGQAGFYIDDIEPDFNASIKGGLIARTHLGPLEATVNPYINLPINNSGPRDNVLSVPVWLYYNIKPRLDVSVVSGVNDRAFMLGGGVAYDLEGPIDLAAHIGWPRLAGRGGAADVLAARLYASINL